MPAGVERIGTEAYRDCRAISELILPETVREISDAAFCGCTGVGMLALPDGLQAVGAFAFSGTVITDVVIPVNVAALGEGAFAECLKLASAHMLSGSCALGPDVFEDCVSLAEIHVLESAPETLDSAMNGYTLRRCVTVSGDGFICAADGREG